MQGNLFHGGAYDEPGRESLPTPFKALLCSCGKRCEMKPITDEGEAFNQDAYCPDHGWAYTISTRKDLK